MYTCYIHIIYIHYIYIHKRTAFKSELQLCVSIVWRRTADASNDRFRGCVHAYLYTRLQYIIKMYACIMRIYIIISMLFIHIAGVYMRDGLVPFTLKNPKKYVTLGGNSLEGGRGMRTVAII